MLKKSASVVLTSLRGSTYGLGKRLFRQAMGGVSKNSLRFAPSLAAAVHAERRVSARRGWVGETSDLFEHPATDPIC